MRVLLVSMPFQGVERPSLGLSLLQGHLRRRGIECDIRYFNLDFAARIGLERYEKHMWSTFMGGFMGGEWAFTGELYGPRPDVDAAYTDQILRPWLDEAAVQELFAIRAEARPFLEDCMTAIPWLDYEVVGFTSAFEQNVSSLALARLVKARYPEIRIVFGGANWEGEMGLALHEQFAFVDLVCSGEADQSFPAVLEALEAGSDLSQIAGIVYRDAGRSVSTSPAAPTLDLDALPLPSFDDFFAQFEALGMRPYLTPHLVIETARGCWWGAHSHCTFCGLNGLSMGYRSKSANRAFEEIKHLRDRYGISHIEIVDNILDMQYFRELLPRLAAELPGLELFWEVKANLKHGHLRALAAAGVRRIQPGIESLSDQVLRLMAKGTTALQNIQLLKWCRELGIQVSWNVIVGFPGEDPVEYEWMTSLIRGIRFLDPPSVCALRLDRFSPYHTDPARYGLVNVRPQAPYRFIYPFGPGVLQRIAYYFDYDHADARRPLDYVASLRAAVAEWRAARDLGDLSVERGPADSIRITDARAGHYPRNLVFRGWKAAVYVTCDQHHTLAKLRRITAAVDEEEVREFLEWCLRHEFMVRIGGRYLALAVHRPARIEAGAAGPVPLPRAPTAAPLGVVSSLTVPDPSAPEAHLRVSREHSIATSV